MRRTLSVICLAILLISFGCHTVSDKPARPLIGITSVYTKPESAKWGTNTVEFSYVRAVADNGGTPVILPTIDNDEILEHYLNALDGLVLIGGDDIPPSAYGQQPHETVVAMRPQRYDFESKLIARWLKSGKPTLGVCLGMQFTNVVAGGTLIQDIPSQIGTTVNHRKEHAVTIDQASVLAEILGATEATVFSYHHQAVDKVAPGFEVVAHSSDGVNEAMVRTDGPFGLYVQWHPELTANGRHRDAIYGSLVRAATEHSRLAAK